MRTIFNLCWLLILIVFLLLDHYWFKLSIGQFAATLSLLTITHFLGFVEGKNHE